MNPQDITRSAVDLYLRAVLAPWKGLARVTRLSAARTSPVEVAVGRVDAALREAAGRVLSDDELLADASRRRAAAEKRSLAVELHEEAEHREEAARERAETRREVVREQARSRKQATRKAAARKKQSISKTERAARLAELEEKEQALDATEEALSEQERAARLRKAAEATKAAR